MIRILIARALARLSIRCSNAANRFYRAQSRIDAQKAVARLTPRKR